MIATRKNTFLHPTWGNALRPTPALFGFDPAVYMDTRLMSGGPFTE